MPHTVGSSGEVAWQAWQPCPVNDNVQHRCIGKNQQIFSSKLAPVLATGQSLGGLVSKTSAPEKQKFWVQIPLLQNACDFCHRTQLG